MNRMPPANGSLDLVARQHGLVFAIGLLALAFVVTVAISLLWIGPFLWHVQQPAAWQGGLEALALLALVFAALQASPLSRAVRWLLLLAPLALYLRRHHVDLALLVSLGYLEGLLALGALMLRRRDDGAASDAWLRELIAGIALFSLLLWLAQLAGYGLPRTQRLLAIAVMVPALLARLHSLHSLRLLDAALTRPSWGERFWCAVLIVLPVVLFARSNVVFDFDSVWYGFRPERVLVGERSVFDALGLVSPVYYFPKLYEVLLLPLSAMRETSVVQGAAIFFGALLARLGFDWLRRLGHPMLPSLAGAALVWSIPAFANVTLSAKPDVLAALLVVAMVWFGWNLIAQRRRIDMIWVFACAGLAISAKIVALPYVGVIGLTCLLGMSASPAVTVAVMPGERRDAWRVLGLCIAVGALVCARTWWLSGMPTIGPEPLVALWHGLGMEFRPPIGTLQWVLPQVWSDVPTIVLGWLASPSHFSHLQISWPGNVWVFLPLVAWLLPREPSPAPAPRWLLWVLPVTGLVMLLGIGFINRGGDGNYFLSPVVMATLAGLDLAWRRCRTHALQRALLLSLALFVAFHSAFSFVSAGWGLGTRVWDGEFARSNRDSPDADASALKEARLSGVAAWLHGQGGRERVMGNTVIGYRLPARYEHLTDAQFAHWIHDPSGQHLRQVMACARLDALLIPATPPQTAAYPAVDEIEAWARALPRTNDLYRDADWRLVNLRDQLPHCAPTTR